MTKTLKSAKPAIILSIILPILAFAIAIVRPGIGAMLATNGLVFATPPILLIGWWAGVLVKRSKGSYIDAGLGGLSVGVAHGIVAIVLFGYAAGGSVAQLLDMNIIETIVAIAGAVAGSGIIVGGK